MLMVPWIFRKCGWIYLELRLVNDGTRPHLPQVCASIELGICIQVGDVVTYQTRRSLSIH